MKNIFDKLLTIVFVSLLMILSPNLKASGDGDMAALEGVVPISITKTKELMAKDNTYVFDANEKEVRDKFGYIPKSIFINKPNWEGLLPEDKSANLIFYCLNRLCFTSSEAALKASKLGYKNSFVMLEGIEKWIILGNEIVKPSQTQLVKSSDPKKTWLESEKIKDYTDGIHSQMIFGKIPSCRDCHGSKTDFDKLSIQLLTANDKDNVNTNCGSCHEDVRDDFLGSVHDKMTNPKENSPSCSNCHGIHTGKERNFINVRKQSDEKCGSCHEEQQLHYHETFHGKALILDNPKNATSVAACFDCHGTHNVFKIDNPKSTLSDVNRAKTCQECHPGANDNFADFMAHADHTNKDKYPLLYYAFIFMTGLVLSVFAFFGFHTLLWSVKLISTRLKYKQEWKLAKQKAHSDKVEIKRFSNFHKIQHFFMAASFLGLSFSGIPQKFYTAPWARTMIEIMGGPIMATKIHHICAIIMIAVFLSHIGEIILHSYKKFDAVKNPNTNKFEMSRFLNKLFGPDSLCPRKQDFIDMKNHFLWFFGKGERPQFDRWTYWEKFDYLAVFWGMFIIGFSGLVLWFPVWFTKFLPGWMLNLSTLVHSDEALLATGFIFAVHFFNTHFRADKFPMDMVIFSGTLTKEELRQERKPWHDRLVQSGEIDELVVKNSNFKSYSWIAKFAGYAMLITGMVFLFLMIYAFLA